MIPQCCLNAIARLNLRDNGGGCLDGSVIDKEFTSPIQFLSVNLTGPTSIPTFRFALWERFDRYRGTRHRRKQNDMSRTNATIFFVREDKSSDVSGLVQAPSCLSMSCMVLRGIRTNVCQDVMQVITEFPNIRRSLFPLVIHFFFGCCPDRMARFVVVTPWWRVFAYG